MRFHDEIVQRDMTLWPFEVIPGTDFGDDKKPLIVVTYKGERKQFSAEEISAMVLMKMKDTAEDYLGVPVRNAVITVPAYFTDSQRQATKDAGTIAGLNVARIINEPTAAAIAYGFEKKMLGNRASKSKVLVFDLGGGTFDVSVVYIEDDIFEVKAVGGHTHLGGDDFDNRMVRHFVEVFKRKHNKDLSQSTRALARLRASCERAKRALSITAEARIELDCLYEGIDFSSTISRAFFDNLNVDLFSECIEVVKRCLSDAQIGKDDIDDIFLVGGSTRIPKVQEILQEFFEGKELSKGINPDEAVAHGAAIHAGILCGGTTNNNRNVVLVDVTPLSLGVEVHYGNMSVVIPRNTTIPTKQKRTFGALQIKERTDEGTSNDSPTSTLEIPLYEGERKKAKENNYLGVFELSGISASKGNSSLINVCFEIDINGILNVSAQDMSGNSRSEITITNRSRLTMEEMDKMISEAEEYKVYDVQFKEMLTAKNTLEDRANELWGKLGYSDNSVGARDGIRQILEWLDWSTEQAFDASKYEEKLEELESICRPFFL